MSASEKEQPVTWKTIFLIKIIVNCMTVKYSPKTKFTAKSAQFCATILLSFLNYSGEKKGHVSYEV